MIAQHRKAADPGLELAQGLNPRLDVTGMSRHIVAGQQHEVGFERVGNFHNFPDVRKRHERSVMYVGDERQGHAAKPGRQVRQCDCPPRKPTPLGFEKRVNTHGRHRAQCGHTGDLEELTSIHRGVRLLPGFLPAPRAVPSSFS